jgi:hypothetical protein
MNDDAKQITEQMREAARNPDTPREVLCKLLEITADHIEGQERVWEVATLMFRDKSKDERALP